MAIGVNAGTDGLYLRGVATLLASWEQYAHGSDGGVVLRLSGVSAGVFPRGPERAVYNNAVFDRGLGPSERGAAIAAIGDVYSDAGVDGYAAWVHEGEGPMRRDLEELGYVASECTRAMGISLSGLEVRAPGADLRRLTWAEYLTFLSRDHDLPQSLLEGVDPDAFIAFGVWLEGENVAAAIAFDQDGDCGIFNMGTLEWARRRGIAGALTAHHLREARRRGCGTATLQATPMAEGVYARAGFRNLGRFFEYVPGSGRASAQRYPATP